MALQQAFIHKQAVLLVSAGAGGCGGLSLGLPAHHRYSPQAREMTLQAMALQQQPLSPSPRPSPPEVSLVPQVSAVVPWGVAAPL